MGQEHGKEQRTDESLPWPWSSSKKHESSEEEKPLDLQKKKPDFTNDNGQYINADRKSFSPFKRSGVAIALTKIQKVSLSPPAWVLLKYKCFIGRTPVWLFEFNLLALQRDATQ